MSIPPLSLTQERARRLLDYIQTYRRLALTQITPSTERNAMQRQLQALQGKLIHDLEQEKQATLYYLAVTSEDLAALLTMVNDLRTLKARETANDQRDNIIVDLSALKVMLDKWSPYGPKKHSTQRLS